MVNMVSESLEMNLLSTVFTYKTQENKFTSALFYLLQRLWRRSATRGYCAELLNDLFNIRVTPEEDLDFSIQPVIHTPSGKNCRIVPDIIIQALDMEQPQCPRIRVLLEVKDESRANRDQVRRYIKHLARIRRNGCQTARLVLLGRQYAKDLDNMKANEFLEVVTWQRLLFGLQKLRCRIQDEVDIFIVDSLIGVLKEKGMVDLIEVTSEFEKGFPHAVSLLGRLKLALEEEYGADKIAEDFDTGRYLGFFFFRHPHISVGVKVDQPGELRMYVNEHVLDDRKCARARSEGTLRGDSDYDGYVFVSRPLSAVYHARGDSQGTIILDYVRAMHREIKELKRG